MHAASTKTERPVLVLSLATEWESRHGGLSSFNREFCGALSALGHQVICLVPAASEGEKTAANELGVTLLVATEDTGLSEEMRLGALRELPGGVVPDVVVGHGRVTGPAAKLVAQYFASRRVHFIHVAPGAIEWFKEQSRDASHRAEEREQLEVALAKSASLVAAVGPLLAREFGILLNASPMRVHEFHPGLAKQALSKGPPGGAQCLVLGRAEDQTLKGLDIAARAFGLLEGLPGPRPILMIRGAPEGTGDKLRSALMSIAGAGSDIRVRPFTPNADRIIDDVHQSSVVMMPSRSEGFGLVGLEAIAAGVPVLLSDRSGLAELLREVATDSVDFHVVSVTGDLEIDGPVWARRLRRVLSDRELAFKRAAALRACLAEKLSWQGSASAMMDAVAATPQPNRLRAAEGNVIPLPGARPSTDRAEIADLSTVRSWGWADGRLQSELYRLDYETMANLTDEHSGLVEQWGPVFAEHPESWRLLYVNREEVIGYWHFTPLFEDLFAEARAGRLLDVTITADKVRSFELPGCYDAYFAGICLKNEFRRPKMFQLLLRSILEVLEGLSKDGVFIGEICANAFTKGGAALCRSLGMRRCAPHVNHGEIYGAQLVELLSLPIASDFSFLREAYRAQQHANRSA